MTMHRIGAFGRAGRAIVAIAVGAGIIVGAAEQSTTAQEASTNRLAEEVRGEPSAEEDDPVLPDPEPFVPADPAIPDVPTSEPGPSGPREGEWVVESVPEVRAQEATVDAVQDGAVASRELSELTPVGDGFVRVSWVRPIDASGGRSASAAAASLKVEVLDEAQLEGTGFAKIAFSAATEGPVGARGGEVQFAVDYDAVRWAYGVDLGTRLSVVRFEDCWLDPKARELESCPAPVPVDGVENALADGVATFTVDAASLASVAVDETTPVDESAPRDETTPVDESAPGNETAPREEQAPADDASADLGPVEVDASQGAVPQGLVAGRGAQLSTRFAVEEESSAESALVSTPVLGGGGGFALLVSPQGDTGDFFETDLLASSGWNVGLNGGSFDWSYSLPIVAPPAGPVPDPSVYYSSGSVDGLIAGENTQGGLFSAGWSFGLDAFIEREYRTCDFSPPFPDGSNESVGVLDWAGNRCWWSAEAAATPAGDEARYRMSMAGHSGLLVFDSQSTVTLGADTWEQTEYRLERDTGLLITRWRLTGSVDRGDVGVDNDREFFTAQSPDGTEYWFGHGKSTGTLDDPNPVGGQSFGGSLDGGLESVSTHPTIGNDVGEPCNALSGSWCHQAYRWSLDRVVDSRDLQMTFVRDAYTNGFDSDLDPLDPSSVRYVADTTISEVYYGAPRAQADHDWAYSGRVSVGREWRCDPSAGPANCNSPVMPTMSGEYFPDLPFDAVCSIGATCTEQSPTFFVPWMPTHLVSYTDGGTGSGVIQILRPVDPNDGWTEYARIDFDLDFFEPTPGESAQLFMKQLQRSGRADGQIDLPPVVFESLRTVTGGSTWCGPDNADALNDDSGYSLPDCGVRLNRVNNWLTGAEGVPPMGFMRINRIWDEQGREISPVYSAIDGDCRNTPNGFFTDHRARCFPGRYDGAWIDFGKYVVDSVAVRDRAGSSPTITYDYDYLDVAEDSVRGGMGWVRSKGEANNSFNDYRGYHEVTVTVGVAGESEQSRHRFMRGMNSTDHPTLDPSVIVPIVPADGVAVVDSDQLAGIEFDTLVLDSTGAEFSRSSQRVTTSATIAGPDVEGRLSRRALPVDVLAHTDGRYSKTTTNYAGAPTFNVTSVVEYGETNSSYVDIDGPTQAAQFDGFADKPDERCTAYTYSAPNSVFPQGLLASTTVTPFASCSSGSVVSKTEVFYDNQPLASANAQVGLVTRERVYTGDSGSVYPSATYLDTDHTYDNSRWQLRASTTDPRGNQTLFDYTDFSALQAENQNIQTLTVTEPLGFVTTTGYDQFARPITTTDPNGRVTERCFDALGRLIDVYESDNSTFDGCDPNDQPAAPVDSSIHHEHHLLIAPAESAEIPVGIPQWNTTSHTLWSLTTDPYHDGGASNHYLPAITVFDGHGNAIETATQSPVTADGQPGGPPLWIVSRNVYDSVGRLTKTSEPLHTATAPSYGRSFDPGTLVLRDNITSYDDYGRIELTELRNITVSSNTLIRSQATTYSGYSTTVAAPVNAGDPAVYGSVTTTTDVYGNTVTVDRAAPGETVPVHTTRYRHNLRFDPIEITDPNGVSTQQEFNDLGWLTEVDHPDRGVTATRYFPTGEVWQTEDAAQQKITHAIDARGRVIRTAAGTNPWDYSQRIADYEYDPTGNKGATERTRAYQPIGTLAWRQTAGTFDDRGRPTSWTIQVDAANDPTTSADNVTDDPYTFSTTYTRTGDVATVDYPAMGGLPTETVTNSYTSLGYLTGSSSPLANYISSAGYDQIGRPTYQNNGSGAVWMNKVWNYRTDDGRLNALQVKARGSGTSDGDRIASQFYTYDAPGNPTVIYNNVTADSLDERECFYYDARQRLTFAYTKGRVGGGIGLCDTTTPTNPTESGPAPYEYDYAYDAGDRFTENADRTNIYYSAPTPSGCKTGTNTTKPYAMANIGAHGGQPNQTFTYNCNGALATRSDFGGSTYTYTYDQSQRLTSVQQDTNTPSTNIYATGNQRVVRIDPNGDRTIYYGTTELRFDKSAATVTAARYYESGAIRTFTNGTTNTTWTARNHHNTIIVSLHTTNGTWDHTRYDPYGAIRNGTPTNDKGFLAQTHDPNQDLIYLNNRHYHPTLGTFTSVDPLATTTMQPYLYGGGNPIAASDPSGLAPWYWFFAWGNYVHALVEQAYLADHAAALAEVSYRAGDFVEGRWDVVDFQGDAISPFEIRPEAAVAAAAEEIAAEVKLFNSGWNRLRRTDTICEPCGEATLTEPAWSTRIVDPVTGVTIFATVSAEGVIGYRLIGEGSDDVRQTIDDHGGVEAILRELKHVNGLNRETSSERLEAAAADRMRVSLGGNGMPDWLWGIGGAVVRVLAGCASSSSPTSSGVGATCAA